MKYFYAEFQRVVSLPYFIFVFVFLLFLVIGNFFSVQVKWIHHYLLVRLEGHDSSQQTKESVALYAQVLVDPMIMTSECFWLQNSMHVGFSRSGGKVNQQRQDRPSWILFTIGFTFPRSMVTSVLIGFFGLQVPTKRCFFGRCLDQYNVVELSFEYSNIFL